MDRMPILPWMRTDAVQAIFAAFGGMDSSDTIRFVGGCVRDALLGRPVEDVDLAVRTPPDRMMHVLQTHGLDVRPVGLAHGVVLVCHGPVVHQLASLREDIATDGRHASIAYTSAWEKDARRRDFRCNALYADWHGALFDPTGGRADIRSRAVVFVGPPEARIREDYLRILRFFRFSAGYADTLDSDGLAACAAHAAGLRQISAERVWAEFKRLLLADSPCAALAAMAGCGVLAHLLPGRTDIDSLRAMVRTDKEMALPANAILRLLCLIPGHGPEIAVRLRMSGAEKRAMIDASGPVTSEDSDMASRARTLYRIGPEAWCARIRLLWARSGGEIPARGDILAWAANWKRPDFPLAGKDALRAGFPPGPDIGSVLRRIEAEWITDDFRDDRSALLERLHILAGR